jgi:hypothetical protein
MEDAGPRLTALAPGVGAPEAGAAATVGPGPILEGQRRRLEEAERRHREAQDRLDALSEHWNARANVVERCERYLAAAAYVEEAGASELPRPGRGDGVDSVRRRIAEARREAARVRSAPLPRKERAEAARRQVRALARAPEVKGDSRVQFPQARVGRPNDDGTMNFANDALAVLAWMDPDGLAERVAATIPADKESGAMSASDREARLVELEAESLRLERLDEALVRGSQTAERRADADPRATLGLSSACPRPEDLRL